MAKSKHFKQARLLVRKHSRRLNDETNVVRSDLISSMTTHNCTTTSASVSPNGFIKAKRNIQLPIQNDKEYLSSAEIVFNSKLKDDIRNNDQQNSSNDVSKRINDNHDMICDHASEQPLSCVETIGVRELTVGELLLGRQQQLNVLRRLKQRMQIEKRNSEHTLIGESSCGDWTRKKYQRTMTSLSDDADRPITALTLGELYRKSWAQRPAVKRFDANDFIRMHTAEIAKSNAALRRKRRITINKEKDLKSTCAESNSTGAAECSLYKLFSMNFSYSTTDPCKVDTPDSDVQRSTDTTCPSSQPQSQSSSTNFTSEASVHNVAQRKSSSVADEIPVSQLLSTPLAPNVFLETMSWMQRQSELADQESFEEYLSATISHLSSGTAFDPNSEKPIFEQSLKKGKLRSERSQRDYSSHRQRRFSASTQSSDKAQKTKQRTQLSQLKEKKDGKYLTSERKISENFNKGAKRELNADADGTKKPNEANSVKAKKDNLRFVAATDSRIEVKEVLPEARSEVSCLEEKANDIERTDAVRYDRNIDEPVGRHVAAKRRRRCNGLIKMEASLDLDDPFQLHCQNSELNQTQKFARSDLTSFCFPSESPRSVLHRGPSRSMLKVKR